FRSIEHARQLSGREPALRFAVPPGAAGVIEFQDRFAGHQRFDVSRELRDFVIAKALEPARGGSGGEGLRPRACQVAVVVDDAEMRVTDLVRGDDLLDSTPRQILLYHALGLADRLPRYYHLPLVVGADGRRLAKRHGDTRLSFYRERGVTAGRVLALLARWCGITLDAEPRTAGDLLPQFRLEHMPRPPIVFTQKDDAWLCGG